MSLAAQIDALWDAGEIDAVPIEEAIRLLDAGEIRVAEPSADGWTVNEWIKKAILLYFRLRKVEPMQAGGLQFLDKIPVKSDYADRGVRVVPPGVARYGSFLSEGVVLMPGYVNIGGAAASPAPTRTPPTLRRDGPTTRAPRRENDAHPDPRP